MDRRNLAGNHNAELRKLCLGCAFSVIFVIIEIVGAWLANSLVIVTDALHLWSVVCSFLISIVALFTAQRQPTNDRMFVYQQAKVLGAFASLCGVWYVASILAYCAIERLLKGAIQIDSNIMMISASLSFLAKGLILAIFPGIGGSSSSHVHSLPTDPLHNIPGIDSSDSESEAASESDVVQSVLARSGNTKVRTALLHVVGDIFRSMGNLVASIVIKYKPEWTFVDPACALFYGLLILVTKTNIAFDLLIRLMAGLPNTPRSERIR